MLEHEGVKAVADESEQTSESLQEEGKDPVVAKQALSPMESEALLDSKQSAQNTDSQDKIAVASAMGEGQQLLGRIEQANQALQTNDSLLIAARVCLYRRRKQPLSLLQCRNWSKQMTQKR